MLKDRLENRLERLGYKLEIEKFINGSPYQKRYIIKSDENILIKCIDLDAVENWILEQTYFSKNI